MILRRASRSDIAWAQAIARCTRTPGLSATEPRRRRTSASAAAPRRDRAPPPTRRRAGASARRRAPRRPAPSDARAAPPARRASRRELGDRPRDRGVSRARRSRSCDVGHLLRQRMLEGVLGHRVERLLVDELGAARASAAPRASSASGSSATRARIGSANSLADHRGGLQHAASRAPAADRCAPPAAPARWPAPRACSTGVHQPIGAALPSSCPDSISDCTTSSVKNGLPPVRAWIALGQPGECSGRCRADRVEQLARSRRDRAAAAGAAGSTTSASSGAVLGAEVDQHEGRACRRCASTISRNASLPPSNQCRSSSKRHRRLALGCARWTTRAHDAEQLALARLGIHAAAPGAPGRARRGSRRAAAAPRAKPRRAAAVRRRSSRARVAVAVLLGDAEVGAEQLEHRQERDRLPVRDAVALVDVHAARPAALEELEAEPALAGARPRRRRRRPAPLPRSARASAASSTRISSSRPTKRERPRARETSKRVRSGPTPCELEDAHRLVHALDCESRRDRRARSSPSTSAAVCSREVAPCPARRAAPCAPRGRRCGPAPCSPCADRRRSCRPRPRRS